MANYFDQFDQYNVVSPEQAGPPPQTRLTVGAPAVGGVNFFDQFDEAGAPDIAGPGGIGFAERQFAEQQPTSADQQRMGDLASAYRQAPEGRGMAVDSRAQAMAADTANNNPYGNASWQGLTFGFGDEIGAGIRTALGQGEGYDFNLAVERELLRRQRQERPIGMAGAEIVGGALPAFLLPGAGVARSGEAATTAATKGPGILDRVADTAGAGAAYGGLYGIGSGEGAEGRLEKGITDAATGAVVGAVAQPVVEGIGAAGRAAVNAVGDYIAPFTQAGRERLAATALNDSAADPAALRYALENPEQIVPSVPGSQPTSYQQTGDQGVGLLERQVQTANPQPFLAREAEQNIARNNALSNIQQTGSPEAVVATMRQHLADIDRSTGDALDAATASARGQTAAMGGAGSPEGYGAAIRTHLDDAREVAKQRENALWNAVDPDGTLALPTSATSEKAMEILRSIPKLAEPMEGKEAAAFLGAAGLKGAVTSFKEVKALRTRVNTLMTAERMANGKSEAWGRLAQLRGAIERDLEGAVSAKATQEQQAVASGAMREEDTIAAMLEKQRRETQEWYDRRAQTVSLGDSVAASAGGYAPGRQGRVSPMVGGEGAAQRRPGAAPGDQGLQGPDGLAPNFDPEAYARLRAASAATKARAQTYDEGIVGNVLERPAETAPYNVPAAAVPEKLFRRGAMGAEGMRALQQAANSPEAQATIRDYAISNLRRFAETADGTLDPARVTVWRRAHADALRAMPEVDRMLAGPVEASEAVANLAVARRQQMDDYQAGAVARLIGLDNAADVTRAVGAIFDARNPVQLMRQLAADARGNPEATEGLRKAVADHMVQRLKSMTEAGSSGQKQLQAAGFQKFVANNEAALKEVLKPGEVSMLKAIAADLERSQRSVSGVKLPGRSNSPQDILAQMKAAGAPQSLFGRLLTIGAQAGVGGAAGGPVGSAVAVGAGEFLSRLRQSGFQKVEEILADALLNPSRAILLLQKVPEKASKADMAAIAKRYRLAAPAVASAANGDAE